MPIPVPSHASIPWHQRLQARMLLCVLLIAGVSLVAVLLAATRVVKTLSLERSNSDLIAAREAFHLLEDSRAQSASRETRLIAELPIFKDALTDPHVVADSATIDALAVDYCGKLKADFCVVSDTTGHWIGHAGAPPDRGATSLAGVIDAARLGRSTSGVFTLGDGLFLVVAEPAVFAEEVLGTFTAAYRLDDSVARELAGVTRCDVTFICSDGHVCGSSLDARNRSTLVALLERDPTPFGSGPTTTPRVVGETSYVGGVYALGGASATARLVLLQDWTGTERALSNLSVALLLVGLATFGVAVVATIVFSQRVTHPFDVLARAANEIAAGDWTRRVATSGPAEATAMAVAFNRMTDALRQREDQLRQAQKMEAIGRLAGGIAHDFNNLLTGILGYTDLILGELATDHPLRPDVKGIEKAGRSAAALTRDLLAFSRKQVLKPVVVDLNEIVEGTRGLLRHVVGASVEIDLRLDGRPQTVEVDRGQMEQVLLNLVANARDAMPSGGRLTIATSNNWLEATSANAGGAAPFVVLSVSDTGLGMSDEVRSRIFEPFFTTKEIGKGTGLGLATVYGIVQQSGGQVRVASAPGHGSTFRVFLPAIHASTTPAETAVEGLGGAQQGSETVLLVEDNESVRALARETLTRRGYRVLEASDGAEALRVAAREADISLLVTDVVMPIMGGRELATRLTAMRGDLKVIFTSGYNEEDAHETPGPGMTFIQKPFTAAELGRAVRDVLDVVRA